MINYFFFFFSFAWIVGVRVSQLWASARLRLARLQIFTFTTLSSLLDKEDGYAAA